MLSIHTLTKSIIGAAALAASLTASASLSYKVFVPVPSLSSGQPGGEDTGTPPDPTGPTDPGEETPVTPLSLVLAPSSVLKPVRGVYYEQDLLSLLSFEGDGASDAQASQVSWHVSGGELPEGLELVGSTVKGSAVYGATNTSFQLSATLGEATTQQSYPVPVTERYLKDVKYAHTGVNHGCALTNGGAVLCWGDNANGQLGNPALYESTIPAIVPGLESGVTVLGVGRYHSCAVKNGSTLCWGTTLNAIGTPLKVATPTTVAGLTNVTSLHLGADFSCARQSDLSVSCWGYGDQLVNSSTPVQVATLVRSFTAGAGHACLVTTEGEAKCWGKNGTVGYLGVGDTSNRSVPTTVVGLGSGVSSISAGVGTTCATMADATVRCWGAGARGQMGNGAFSNSMTPVVVTGLSGVAQVEVGNNSVCARVFGAGLRCWGGNDLGELGRGFLDGSYATPGAVSGMRAATHLGKFTETPCATTDGGGAKCWGSGGFGQLGDNSYENKSTPGGLLEP